MLHQRPMRWRTTCTRLVHELVWVCLILGIAAYGAVVVQHVTEALVDMAYQQTSVKAVPRPNR